jgi:ABC-type glycerol-3-phosphate transport system substrate-binding protein
MRLRKDTALLIAALAVLIIVGFAFLITSPGKKQPGQHPFFSFTDRVTIGFSQWWAQNEQAKVSLQKILAAFEAQNPDVKVVLDTRREGDIYDALNSAPAALGEVVAVDSAWDIKGLSGRTQALSFPYLLFYNIDILSSVGFDRPPASRDDVVKMAAAVEAQKKGLRGLDLCFSPQDKNSLYRDFYSWFWAAGIPLSDDGSNSSTGLYVNRASARTVLGFFAQLGKGGLLSGEALTRSGTEGFADFLAGKDALIIAPSNKLVPAEKAGLNFGIAPIPGPEELAGKPLLAFLSWQTALNTALAEETDKQKDAAKRLVAFLAQQSDALSAALFPQDAKDPLVIKAQDIQAASGNAGDLAGLDRSFLGSIVRDELPGLIAGTSSPDDAAKEIQSRWDAGRQ